MEKPITPQEVRSRATAAHAHLITLLKRAGIAKSTFWRWEKGATKRPHSVTLQKLSDALADLEAEKAR